DADGASSLPGMSACGECASTGAHGANRLASNSLLEAVVFGGRIAQRLNNTLSPPVRAATGQAPGRLRADGLAVLRTFMARHAGVERNREGLTLLLEEIDELAARNGEGNAITAARLVAASALAREESRGAHFRTDFPAQAAEAKRTRL